MVPTAEADPVRGTIDVSRLRPLDPSAARARVGRLAPQTLRQLDRALRTCLDLLWPLELGGWFEVSRLTGLGAGLVEFRQDPDSMENRDTWAVLEDPEGNVFCVSRSATLSGVARAFRASG
jgi:hypothetical protein